jgi:hypothetical protein
MRKSLPPARFELATPSLGNLCAGVYNVDNYDTCKGLKAKNRQTVDFAALHVLKKNFGKSANQARVAVVQPWAFFIGG